MTGNEAGRVVEHGQGRGVSLRAVLWGAALSLWIGVSLPYTNMIIKGGLLAHNHNTPAALFVFFLFVGLVHTATAAIKRSSGYSRGELATIYIMAMMATVIPTIGFSEYLLPIIAGFTYYATPENAWRDTFHPFLPRWAVPQDEEAVRHFYEGLPEGLSLPWGTWVEPVFYWVVFILAVYWTSACAMVIVRRQWMEREKLLYPLVQLPLDMIRDDGAESILKPFFRNSTMWIGFAVPFLVGSYNSLHAYFPAIPEIPSWGGQGPLITMYMLFRGTTEIIVMLNFGLVGFAYLLSRDIALGLWLFALLAVVQRGIFNVLGIASTESLSRFANNTGPFLAHQAMGAMMVLLFSGLWMGRQHLQDVFRKAFGRDDSIDDSDEVLSYRTAVFGMFFGLAIVSIWLWQSGMPLWIVPIFLFAVLVVFVTLTRAVVEGGVAVIRAPLMPADFVISGLGTDVLGGLGIASMGLTYVWASNIRIFFMPAFANALRMAEEIGHRKHRLKWAIGIAVILALGGSLWSVLVMSYKYGGVNLHEFWFIGVPGNAGSFTSQFLLNPSPPNWGGWMFTAIGAAIQSLLVLARARLIWWPLHPLGFVISSFDIMTYVWFSVLISWGIKSIVLKYGGPTLYRSTRPFFLGLILGQICVAGFWLIIDFCTGMQGNAPIGGSFV
ncbi:MAG: hypothetical protein O2782_01970 [bacterium]|nr:hypothetical protein [bacterium]